MQGNVEQAFGGTRPMLSVIESIYAAVDTPQLWDATLRNIGDLLGGESIALFAGAPNAQTPHLLSVSEMDPGAWQQFVQHYAAINPIMQRCEKLLDPEATWFAHSVMSDGELENTEFYADFFQPNAMHHSVGMRMRTETLPMANLSCQRSKSAGAFGGEADVILQTLRPHLMRALSLRKHLGAMEAQKHGLESALDAYDHAVIGIDAYGRVALCSTHAQAMLVTDCGLTVKNRRLCCKHPSGNASLQQLITTAIQLHNNAFATPAGHKPSKVLAGKAPSSREVIGKGNSMLLPSRSGEQELRLTVLPHRRSLPGQSAPLAALVFLSHSAHRPGSRAATLIGLYSLTPTEARIADLLATGLDTPEIAAQLKLTKETARFYIKRILVKTGTRRQLDLLRLVLSLPVA